MRNPREFSFIKDENPQGPVSAYDRGPYDAEPLAEEDLWFLPPDDHPPGEAAYEVPLPRADQRPLVDVAAWAAAEAALAGRLADLALLLGRLAARLEAGPAGWRQRLALREAADLSWLAGDRVPMERLALWLTLRVGGEGDDAQALARAGWAARRLTQAPAPKDDLAGFLGRFAPEADDGLADQIADWTDVMGQGASLHPITQAALSYHIWPVVGFAAGHPSLPMIEAAVVAARHAAVNIAGLGFLPLSIGGAGGLRGHGTAAERLAAWVSGADQAARATLRQLDGLAAWQAKAEAETQGWSGKTPRALAALLAEWPLVSAPMAEAETGASRAAVQRNLNRLTEAGLIREVTGQRRYRMWAATSQTR
ncbi:helix-turn-helix domain-containing protein [Yoonia litorea]|nr:helix-turn-helix domain-containing protein [Yoonia litorea]